MTVPKQTSHHPARLSVLARKAVLAASLLLPLAAHGAQLVDRIAAVVNDDVITVSELDGRLQQAIQQLTQRMGEENLPPRSELRRQLLDRMILNRIQIQRAEQRGIQVSAQELDEAVNRIAQQNEVPVSRLREALEQRGIDYADYRDRLREQLIRERLTNQSVRAQIHITEEEVESYLARQGTSTSQRYEYNLQHILVAVPEEASPKETEKLEGKAQRLRKQVTEGGEEFGKVAAAESDGQNALDGGELGWFQPGELPGPVTAEIEGVEPGHVSRVVRTPSGFHLFKVTERREKETAKETQVEARHIVLRTGSSQSSEQARALARELKERLEGGADFRRLARQFSEGSSAQEGGSLGWVSRGELAPGLEELLFSLEPGQIGGPVQTQLGIHVAEVLDRREKEIDPENKRKQARQALRTRKTRERMDQWLRELRAQAFVDIRLKNGGSPQGAGQPSGTQGSPGGPLGR